MGDRANVFVQQRGAPRGVGVWLYTHYDGAALPATLRAALAMRLRWKDDSYLTRIIFQKMLDRSFDRELGFGISSAPTDGRDRVLVVDCAEQTVSITAYGRDALDEPASVYTFEEYIALRRDVWRDLSRRPRTRRPGQSDAAYDEER